MIGMSQLEVFLDRIDHKTRQLLAAYLATEGSTDHGDPEPNFTMPRSREVDQLLSHVTAKADWRAITSLRTALKEQQEKAPRGGSAKGSWSRNVACQIHFIEDLRDRLVGYVRAYLKAQVSGALPGTSYSGAAKREQPRPQQQEPQHQQHQPQQDDELAFISDAPPFEIEEDEPSVEVTRLRRELMELRASVIDDTVTGLRNRSYFDRRLAEEVSRATRGDGGFSLMLVSLEARVLTGDRIRQVAKQIAGCMRDYDLCCRIGPREFMIIFPGASTEGCASIVARLSQRLAVARVDEGVRIGGATWEEDGTTAKDLIRSAERYVESGGRRPASRKAEQLTSVWFEGVANAIRAQAVQTTEGLRLRVPLGFVRVGASVSFDAGDGGRRTGKITEAAIGGGRRRAPVPVLQVDVDC